MLRNITFAKLGGQNCSRCAIFCQYMHPSEMTEPYEIGTSGEEWLANKI